MWGLCISCLYFTAASCLLAIFSRSYDDNFAMRLGMAVVCLACLGRAVRLQHEQAIAPDSAVFVIGVAVFAAGSGWRHIRWRQIERRHAERRQKQRRINETQRSHP